MERLNFLHCQKTQPNEYRNRGISQILFRALVRLDCCFLHNIRRIDSTPYPVVETEIDQTLQTFSMLFQQRAERLRPAFARASHLIDLALVSHPELSSHSVVLRGRWTSLRDFPDFARINIGPAPDPITHSA